MSNEIPLRWDEYIPVFMILAMITVPMILLSGVPHRISLRNSCGVCGYDKITDSNLDLFKEDVSLECDEKIIITFREVRSYGVDKWGNDYVEDSKFYVNCPNKTVEMKK